MENENEMDISNDNDITVNQDDQAQMTFEEMEKEARLELEDFLSKKDLDPRLGDAFKLIIKVKDSKVKDYKKLYSVQYAAPNGSICQTKRDVSEAILYQFDCGSVLTQNHAKIESYQSSMKEVNAIINQGLPKRIENYKVFNFGKIDKRPSFHNKYQIYPVGYLCEITLDSLDSNATIYGDKYVLECEVRARLDDQPDFVITNKTTGGIYWAVGNEREVWKKFDPNNLYGDSTLSFFNLKIELLIEGLDGAVELEAYTYHVERGYGVSYHTQEESMTLKASSAPRERNRVQRLQTVGLTREEMKIKEEQLREQQAIDKEFTKTIAKADQERKAKEREELKKIKEQEVLFQKEKREEEKRLKDMEKLEQKRNRASIDPSEKGRDSIANDITSSDYLQIIRDEANNLVIENYDEEQDEKEELEFCSLLDSKDSLESILQNSKSCSEYFGFSDLEKESGTNINWDALLNVASTLSVYGNHLQHQVDVSLTTLINYLVSIASKKEKPMLEKFFDFLDKAEEVKESSGNLITVNGEKADTGDMEISNKDSNIYITPKSFPSIYESIEREATAETDQIYNDDLSNRLTTRFKAENLSVKKKFGVPQPKFELDPLKYSSGAIERFQLCLLEKIYKDCALFFDLDEREVEVSGKPIKKQHTLPTLRYPLNQMTFQEIARMSIQSYLLKELGKSTEDIQCAIRGSRQIPNRSAKSVVRQIRYRIAARSQLDVNLGNKLQTEIGRYRCNNDDHLTFLSDIAGYTIDNDIERPGTESDDQRSLRAEIAMADKSDVRSLQNYYDTEQELSQKLIEILGNNSYPEVYHRCCKIMQKLFSISMTKSFLWEVDRSSYPDYYTVIRNPIMLCNIVGNLANKMYGELEFDSLDDLEFDALVVVQFRNDLTQVFNNCFIFNSEISFLFTHAQKLQLVAHRHIDRWIISQQRPPLSACDEKHCLLSNKPISPGSNSRCSRCAGEYDQEYLKQQVNSGNPWLFPISASLKSEDDWICPFCLREDSKLMKIAPTNRLYIDEWGPSSFMPWILETGANAMLSSFVENNTFFRTLIKACLVLSDPNKSAFEVNDGDNRTQWTTADRISVLDALCETMKQNDVSHNYISQLYEESNKLTKTRKTSAVYRRAEYVESLKVLFGDMGPKLLDLLLSNDEDIVQSDEELCQLCLKSTTFTEETSSDIIIICDGCSKEFHLKCAGYEEVPEDDWYCRNCSESTKIETVKSIDYQVKVEDYRNHRAEEALIIEASQKRSQKSNKRNKQSADRTEILCFYCGYGELDVCSPLVVGQNIYEHDVFMKDKSYCCANNVFLNKDASKATFRIGGSDFKTNVSVPYFPYLDNVKGAELIDNILNISAEPVVVHELCALQMFEARLTRNKHSLRRKRNMISKKLSAMAGVPIRPLGVDSCGREYWRFPNSLHLFICTTASVDQEKIEFHDLLGISLNEPTIESIAREWKVLVNPNDIKKAVAALGNSKQERKLRQNIINLVLSDYKPSHYKLEYPIDNSEMSYKALENLVANHSTDSCIRPSENSNATAKFDKSDKSAANDSIPFALKLVIGKGNLPIKRYCIPEEAAYTDLNPGTNQEEMARFHEQFFHFHKGKYFCVSIVNKSERKIIKSKDSGYGIQYIIYREECTFPLMSDTLTEPYTDGYYYFLIPQWKRSGKYKIAFYLTGPGNVQLSNIFPLIYHTTVISREIKQGASNALDQLIGKFYLHNMDRQAIHGRVQFNIDEKDRRYLNNELSAVKHALMTVYFALPNGALGDYGQENEDNDTDVFTTLSEGNTWDSSLDETWRTSVKNANDPVTLMECAILLEYYIQKPWIQITHSRLLNSLPTPIYGLRSATYSAVALRVFVLDKCLDYEKVNKKEREKRGRVIYDPTAYDYGSKVNSASKAEESAMETTRSGRRSIKTGSADMNTNSSEFSRSKRGLDEPYEGDFERLTTKRKKEESISKKIFYGDHSDHHNQLLAAFPFDDLIKSLSQQIFPASNIRLLSDDIKHEVPLAFGSSEMVPAEDYLNYVHNVPSSSTPAKVEVLTDSNEITEVVDAIIDNDTLIMVPGEATNIENNEENDEIDNSVDEMTVKFYTILREFQSDPKSLIFWEEVDTKLFTDYKKIVKEPMDFGTIATRVMKGYYQSHHQIFASDMKKVLTACKIYNKDDPDLYELASSYETLFENLYETHIINFL